MPKIKTTKTYLEQVDPTPVMGILRFLHSGRYSPLVRSMRYALLGLCGDVEADAEARVALRLSEAVTDESLFSLETTRKLIRGRLDKQEWSRRLLPYLQGYARHGVPFRNFEDEPAAVSQLKKIVNALYHTEEALKIAESIDIEGLSLEVGNTAPETLSRMYGPFVEHIYESCMLLTHPDVDMTVAFGDEWRQINSLIFDFVAKIPAQYREQSKFLHKEYGVGLNSPEAVAGQFGRWSGATLEGLKPTRVLNYSTVSYFGADSSTYLNRLTTFIQDTANRYFTASYLNQRDVKVESYEISEVRLRELEQASIKLEKAFKSLHSEFQILQPLNAYALIAVAKNTTTLVQSVIEESGHFRAETEELVRAALAQLKYQLFLQLVKSVDKIEEESVTEPGVLSVPLVERLDEFYQTLFSYVSGFVDLSSRGQDLSRLVDSRFIELRQQALYERQAEREKKLIENKSREKIIDEFFTLLSRYRGKRLSTLNLVEKTELLERFSVVQPLIAEDDITLSNKIAEALLPPKIEPVHIPTSGKQPGLGEKLLDGLVYAGTQVYRGLSAAYDALDSRSDIPSSYFGDYADRVDLLDEGYTFEVLRSYEMNVGPGYTPEFSPSEYMPDAMFSTNRIYVKAIGGKIALGVKKPNGAFFSNVMTPFDAPAVPLSLEVLKPVEQELLHFARGQGLIQPSLHQRLKQRIRKEEATFLFRSQISADCRAKIYQSSGELLQHLYPKEQNAYFIDESKILENIEIDSDATIELSRIEPKKLLQLYQSYAVVCDKLSDAESSMSVFFRTLETYAHYSTLSALPQKNELRHLYAMIQPYLISSLRKLKGDHFAANFDQSMIDAFSGRTTRGKALLIRNILDVKTVILDDLQQNKMMLTHRKERIHASIFEQASVDRVQQLILNNPHGRRTGYVVKDPKYTKYMKEVAEQLEQFTKTWFSPEIQKKLVVRDRNSTDQAISFFLQFESKPLPFPEAEQSDYLQYLKEEKQVLVLKQFYNCVHHLREVAIQFEHLSDYSYQTEYVWRSIMLEEHLRSAIMLYQEMSQDETLIALGTDLRRSLDVVIEAFKTLSSPYAPDKADKDANIEAVRDPVFYIVNGIVIAREQIDAWQQRSYISEKTAKEAQIFSEKISERVRKIVEANSYLEWVLQSETFYHLFYDMKERWNKFAASSTNAIEANLESIYTENFTNMLIVADEWERKAGLTAGAISGALKEILDAYYFGMVEVLSHDTGHQISLATTQIPFVRRQEHLSRALETEKQNVDDAEKNLSFVRRFKTSVSQHPEAMVILWQHSELEGQDDYRAFLELLEQMLSLSNVNDYLKKVVEPEILAVIRLQHQPSLGQIPECQEAFKKVLEVCEARLEGDRNTARLSAEHCYLQRDKIRQLLVEQEAKNQKMKNEIIKKLILKTLVNYQSGEKRLLFVRDLYDNALKEEVETHIDDFLKGLAEYPSVEKQVKAFLDEKVKAFDDRHLAEFRQFNELHYSLSELESYLHSQNKELTRTNSFYRHTWSLESTSTLALKSRLHQSLKRILEGKKTSSRYSEADIPEMKEEGEDIFDPDDKWHIKARVERFKKVVESPRFVDSLLRTEDTYKISPLSWLVKWFVGLLCVLGVYKTEAEVIHEHLKASVKQQSTSTIVALLNQKSEPSDSFRLSMLSIFAHSKPTKSKQVSPEDGRPGGPGQPG